MSKKRNRRFRQIIKVLLKHKLTKGVSPQKMRSILEDLGPTFVKLGQIMSTREDLIPKEYCIELAKLRENVKPLVFETVISTIEAEFKKPVSEMFSSIDENPLGSASIGQVHHAFLLDHQEVVIKVMRPGIYEIVEQDIALLKSAATLLKISPSISEVIDFKMLLDETWNSMKEEMNYTIELQNIKEMTKLNEQYAYIGFPKIYEEYCTSKVLVMEYIDGFHVEEMATLKNAGYHPNEICEKLVENYMNQILDVGVFHADPHAGNLTIRDGQIVWLDLGMIGRISNRDRKLFKKGIQAILDNNVSAIQMMVLSLGVCKRQINHSQLYLDIDYMMSKYMGLGLGEMDMGVIMEDFMRVARNNGIALPHGMTMLGRGLIIIQGVAKMLNPDYNLMLMFSHYMMENMMDDINPKEKAAAAAKLFYHTVIKSAQIPSQIADLLNLTVKGQSRFNVEVTNMKDVVHRADNIANKCIIGIILSALTVALAVVIAALLKVEAVTATVVLAIILVCVGYFLVFLLVILLLIMIYRDKRK